MPNSYNNVTATAHIPEKDIAAAVIHHGVYNSINCGPIESATVAVYQNGNVSIHERYCFRNVIGSIGAARLTLDDCTLNHDCIDITEISSDSVNLRVYNKDSPRCYTDHKFEAQTTERRLKEK
jgi:hypothetical protein